MCKLFREQESDSQDESNFELLRWWLEWHKWQLQTTRKIKVICHRENSTNSILNRKRPNDIKSHAEFDHINYVVVDCTRNIIWIYFCLICRFSSALWAQISVEKARLINISSLRTWFNGNKNDHRKIIGKIIWCIEFQAFL